MQLSLKKAFSTFTLSAAALFALHAEDTTVISSTSVIDWTQNTFTSSIALDVEKAGIHLPSGKNSAITRINQELPTLIKDPLLSIYVYSET